MKTTDDEKTQWFELENFLSQAISETKSSRIHYIQDIFKTALKLAKESPGTLNLKITSTVLRELRYSFKIFTQHRKTPKITIFGSARVPRNTPLYQLSKKFAAHAVKNGYLIVTGGGPGIMAAGNEGAQAGGFGLNIRLPVEQTPNPFIDTKNKLIQYKYFFTRKLFLVKEACAFVFFPGGFGTFDEAFEVLTLLQTGKSDLIPVILLETKGYGFWKEFIKFTHGMQKHEFISKADFNLFTLCEDADAALKHIEQFYHCYHSMRNVQELLVIRLKKMISKETLDTMHKKFGHLSKNGTFALSGPLEEEANEPELSHLHRLVFPFEKNDYGTLRALLDFINKSTV